MKLFSECGGGLAIMNPSGMSGHGFASTPLLHFSASCASCELRTFAALKSVPHYAWSPVAPCCKDVPLTQQSMQRKTCQSVVHTERRMHNKRVADACRCQITVMGAPLEMDGVLLTGPGSNGEVMSVES